MFPSCSSEINGLDFPQNSLKILAVLHCKFLPSKLVGFGREFHGESASPSQHVILITEVVQLIGVAIQFRGRYSAWPQFLPLAFRGLQSRSSSLVASVVS
jgi:hypothetical protein